MLTLEKLKIYKSFKGDIDFFGKSLNNKIKSILSEKEFYLITELIQDMVLIKNNLSSDIFTKEIMDKIKRSFGDNYFECQKIFDELVLMEINDLKNIHKKK